jgi:hypothetical protein
MPITGLTPDSINLVLIMALLYLYKATKYQTLKASKFISSFLIVVSSLIFNNITVAQSVTTSKADTAKTRRPENVYFESGSAGLFFSLNYDTRFTNERNGLGGRLGIGTWKSAGTTFVTVPFQLNYLIGRQSNFLELGAGATLLALNGTYYGNPLIGNHVTSVSTTVLPTTTIGYRHQPYHHGVDFGVSVNPMLLDGTFIPYFGVSVGYTFK